MIHRKYSPNPKTRNYKFFVYVTLVLVIVIIGVVFLVSREDYQPQIDFRNINSSCLNEEEISQINQTSDVNQKILEGAKYRTNFEVEYIDRYYSTNSGKPPEGEGVCTDLFWRAMERAGVDFVKLINEDIRTNPSDYPLNSWNGVADSNIDYRRVPNLEAYFRKYAEVLPTTIEECDYESISQWQPGDIVIFNIDGVGPNDHIAIVSDSRAQNGIPYLIHNWGSGEKESSGTFWFDRVVGHYRWRDAVFRAE
jgi:uncharacterized protein